MSIIKMYTNKSSPIDNIKYITNPLKTTFFIPNVIVRDGEKTVYKYREEEIGYPLISYIGCSNAENAGSEFTRTQRIWRANRNHTKLHHIVQSFDDNYVDPVEIHQIGLELIKEIFGERHQVVLATHLNTNHIHNHISYNPISDIDGKRIVRTKAFYFHLVEVSDKIVANHGLKVLPPITKFRGFNYWEKKDDDKGYYTTKGIMNADIRLISFMSDSMSDFYSRMRDLGYSFTNDIPPKLKLNSRNHYRNLDRLGKGCSYPEIERTINSHDYWYNYMDHIKKEPLVINVENNITYDLGFAETYFLLGLVMKELKGNEEKYFDLYWDLRDDLTNSKNYYDDGLVLMKYAKEYGYNYSTSSYFDDKLKELKTTKKGYNKTLKEIDKKIKAAEKEKSGSGTKYLHDKENILDKIKEINSDIGAIKRALNNYNHVYCTLNSLVDSDYVIITNNEIELIKEKLNPEKITVKYLPSGHEIKPIIEELLRVLPKISEYQDIWENPVIMPLLKEYEKTHFYYRSNYDYNLEELYNFLQHNFYKERTVSRGWER